MQNLIIKTKIDYFNFQMDDRSYLSARLETSFPKRLLPFRSYEEGKEVTEPFMKEGEQSIVIASDDPYLRTTILTESFLLINEECSGVDFFPYHIYPGDWSKTETFGDIIKGRLYCGNSLEDTVIIRIDMSKLLSLTLDGRSLI